MLTQLSQQTVRLIKLFIVKPTSKIRTSQAIDGFITYPTKPSFTVGFLDCQTKDYTQGQVNTKTKPSEQVGLSRYHPSCNIPQSGRRFFLNNYKFKSTLPLLLRQLSDESKTY